MKKIIFFFLISHFLLAQEITSENYFWEYNYNENGIQAVIGAKNCYVREEPTANSTLLDSLKLETKSKF